MVPSLFVTLDALPLTVTGKVDRRSLPSPECTRPALEIAYISPRSPLEESLTRLWAEVLRLDRVGIHDNFLELGGHSLLATRVVSRVREAFQVEVPLRSLFEAPTVAEMAEVIGKTLAGRTDDQKLDQMLADLGALSDEEARSLLDRESS
jgi:acyl carrier protein